MSGGQWGLVTRRIFEAGTRLLPYCILLFIPVAAFAPKLYLWAQPDVVSGDEILKLKAPYLNVTFWIVRAAVYFVFWWFCAMLLNKWSAAQDRGEVAVTEADTRRFRVVSAPGLVIFVLLMSLAAVDWIMSLDPHWYSTIFGFILVVGQTLCALSFTVAVLAILAPREPMHRVLRAMHFHDLGKLMLALVMLWAYFLVLPVPDHLGRQPARRDSVLPGAADGRLEVPEPVPGVRPLRPAVLPAAVGRPEEAAEPAGARRVVHRRDPALRHHLARRARVQPGGRSRSAWRTSGSRWRWPAGGSSSSPDSCASTRCCRSTTRISSRCSRSRTMGGTEMSSDHEESDINVRAIIWFVVVLTVIVLAVDVAMYGLFKALDYYEVKNDPPVSPLAHPPAPVTGGPQPAPGLQTTPWVDLKQFRAEQDAYLHGYGWVDEKAGVARVPIEKAKALLLKQGLPVRPELADALEGTHVAAGGESNGGRSIPAGRRGQVVAPARRRRLPRPPTPASAADQARGRPVIQAWAGVGHRCALALALLVPASARAVRQRAGALDGVHREARPPRQGRDRPEDRAAAAARPDRSETRTART